MPNRPWASRQGPAAPLGLTQPPGHVVSARPTPLAQHLTALPHDFHGSPSYIPVRTVNSRECKKQVSLPHPLPCGRGSGLSAGRAGWRAPTCTRGAGRSHTVTGPLSVLNPTLPPSPSPAKIQTFFSGRKFKPPLQWKGLTAVSSTALADGHPSEESRPSLSGCVYERTRTSLCPLILSRRACGRRPALTWGCMRTPLSFKPGKVWGLGCTFLKSRGKGTKTQARLTKRRAHVQRSPGGSALPKGQGAQWPLGRVLCPRRGEGGRAGGEEGRKGKSASVPADD